MTRVALAAVLAVALPAWADDAPPMHSAGQIEGVVAKAGDKTVTIKAMHLQRSGRRSLREAEKDHDYKLDGDAKVRWHELPKKPDGKSYTDAEYQSLREPAGTVGYKADKGDLHAGQTVRLYLSKAGKDEAPVVTVVLIVKDAPKHDDKKK
jgi:hypothetical protein